MTLIYLLRHAESNANVSGVLAGRMDGVALSNRGIRQSRQIAKVLKEEGFTRIYTSPLERCRQTIQPLLSITGKRAVCMDAFLEMNYGDWSGKKLVNLRKEKIWRTIQNNPTMVTFPAGESFIAASNRIKRGLNQIAKKHPKGKVLVVTHGDPIKIALQLTLAGDLDKFQKIVIDPGSVSIIDWPNGVVLGVNFPVNGLKKKTNSPDKSNVSNRRILGGGTDVAHRI